MAPNVVRVRPKTTQNMHFGKAYFESVSLRRRRRPFRRIGQVLPPPIFGQGPPIIGSLVPAALNGASRGFPGGQSEAKNDAKPAKCTANPICIELRVVNPRNSGNNNNLFHQIHF